MATILDTNGSKWKVSQSWRKMQSWMLFGKLINPTTIQQYLNTNGSKKAQTFSTPSTMSGSATKTSPTPSTT